MKRPEMLARPTHGALFLRMEEVPDGVSLAEFTASMRAQGLRCDPSHDERRCYINEPTDIAWMAFAAHEEAISHEQDESKAAGHVPVRESCRFTRSDGTHYVKEIETSSCERGCPACIADIMESEKSYEQQPAWGTLAQEVNLATLREDLIRLGVIEPEPDPVWVVATRRRRAWAWFRYHILRRRAPDDGAVMCKAEAKRRFEELYADLASGEIEDE